MNYSFYDVTIPSVTRAMHSLREILRQGKQYAADNNITEDDMLSRKLYDDMFDLRTQVAAVYLLVFREGVFRAVGFENSKANPAAQSFDDLDDLLKQLLEELGSIDVEDYNSRASESVQCDLPIGQAEFKTFFDHMTQWVIPHMYFHVTTAYDILRHNGVPLGKSVYLGSIDMALKSK